MNMTITHNSMTASVIMEINMEDFTFRQYLKESGYDKMSYQEEVYTTCLGLGNYQNIDLYYQDEIDEAYEQNVPVNKIANSVPNLI